MQKFAISDVFCPKLFTSLTNYDKKTLTQDIVAGIIVGVVAISLATAFGT